MESMDATHESAVGRKQERAARSEVQVKCQQAALQAYSSSALYESAAEETLTANSKPTSDPRSALFLCPLDHSVSAAS